jgi:hypothetical protein
VSALRSPVFPRASERDQVGAEQADDFVQFRRAGASAKGWFRCVDCGFGVATGERLPVCTSCRGELWERAETSPFGLGAPAMMAETDLHAAAAAIRGVFVAVAIGSVLWICIAALAIMLTELFHR